MPIQPRWPILRLNAASIPVQDSAFSTGLRSASSVRRKSRTSRRSASASGQGGGDGKLKAFTGRSSALGYLPVDRGSGRVNRPGIALFHLPLGKTSREIGSNSVRRRRKLARSRQGDQHRRRSSRKDGEDHQ